MLFIVNNHVLLWTIGPSGRQNKRCWLANDCSIPKTIDKDFNGSKCFKR